MPYIVVYGGTTNNTDASYCLTLDDVKLEIEQVLSDYGHEDAASLEVYEVGKRVKTKVEWKVGIG